MLFIVYIVLVLAAVLILPYIVFAVKRVYLTAQLTAICRRKGYIFTPLKPLWWLDTVKSGSPACKIETADTYYVVKIIGTLSKKQHLRFLTETQFAVRSLRFETHMTAKAAGYTYKQKEPYRFDDVQSPKALYPVILLHPAPTTISVKRSNSCEKADTPSYVTPKADPPKQNELLQNGDFTGEGYVYTLKSFADRL